MAMGLAYFHILVLGLLIVNYFTKIIMKISFESLYFNLFPFPRKDREIMLISSLLRMWSLNLN